MRYIFVVNPAAGKDKKALSLIPEIQKVCEKTGAECEIYISKSGEGITDYVGKCCEKGEEIRFYAIGGDGTLNRVVNGRVGWRNVAVGVIPLGTGNDFIKTVNLPRGKFFDIEAQINGDIHPCDLLMYNGKYSVNMVNIGFDADVAADMPKFKGVSFITNDMAYKLALFYNFTKKLGRELEIYTDDKLLYKGDVLMCAIGNGISCGGGFLVTAKAKTDDGLIDVSAVTPPPRLQLPGFIKYFTAGVQFESPKVQPYIHFSRCKTVKITGKKPFSVVNDGESEKLTEIQCKIVPGGFNFIIPKNR